MSWGVKGSRGEGEAYLRAGLDCFLDEHAALGQVVGHAGRRGQLADGLWSDSRDSVNIWLMLHRVAEGGANTTRAIVSSSLGSKELVVLMMSAMLLQGHAARLAVAEGLWFLSALM